MFVSHNINQLLVNFLKQHALIQIKFNQFLNEPRYEISNNVLCATSKASNQPSHTRSLISAFVSGLNIL